MNTSGNFIPCHTQLARFGGVPSTGMNVHLPWEARDSRPAEAAFLVLHQHQPGSTPEQVPEVLQANIPALRATKGCTTRGTYGVLLWVYAAIGQQEAEMMLHPVSVPAALH